MPYKDKRRQRKAVREANRRYEARKRADRAKQRPAVEIPPWPADPAVALAEWAADKLVIPPGHPAEGQPLVLPAFAVDFLAAALTHRESLLSVARKNAKSAVIAAYLLGRLVGPLRTAGYRAGVASVNREKARELLDQVEAIALASGIDGITFRRAPLHAFSDTGRVDILAADKSSGHASGFDDSIVDELGLLTERDRPLINGLKSAVSARDGRFWAISIQGAAPFTAELVKRRDDPAVHVALYEGDPKAPLDDPANWIP